MATVLPDSKNFANTEKAFLKQSLEDYSSYLNSLPLLVEYYSKDHFNSTFDENLGTVQEILGPDSPVKFNKIQNFPLYKASILEGTEDDSEEVGTEGDVQGTAIVPPQQVYPRVDDLFIIKFYGKETVFRVSSVKRSNIKGKSFYEISYYLYSTLGDGGNIDNQVKKEYKVVGSPSSVTKSAILAVDKAEICERLQNKIELLINRMKAFYSDEGEAYLFDLGTGKIRWDECVHAFIAKNGLFDRSIAYRNEVILRSLDPLDNGDFYDQYSSSIYFALEQGNYSLIDDSFSGVSEWACYTEELPLRFKQGISVVGCIFNGGTIKTNFNTVFGNLKEYILDTTDTIEPTVKLAEGYLKLLKYYVNDPVLENIVDYLDIIKPGRTIYDYYYLPIALFIYKDLINRIRKIYNFNN